MKKILSKTKFQKKNNTAHTKKKVCFVFNFCIVDTHKKKKHDFLDDKEKRVIIISV